MSTALVVLGPVLALVGSLAVAVIGYRKGMKGDEIAVQAGNVTSIGQVVDGLNSIIAALQSDNEVLRARISELQNSSR